MASGEFQVKSGARVVAIAQVAHSSTEATVEFRSTVDGTRSLSLPNVGAALKWADLDGDGAPELITSTATRESKQDRLQIFSSQEGKLSKVADLAEGAVHAVGVCPFNGKNPLPLVAVVGDKLWVLR